MGESPEGWALSVACLQVDEPGTLSDSLDNVHATLALGDRHQHFRVSSRSAWQRTFFFVATEAEEEVEIDFSFSAESAALPFAHAEVELVHDAHGWLDIPLNGPCGGSVRVQLKHIPAEQAMSEQLLREHCETIDLRSDGSRTQPPSRLPTLEQQRLKLNIFQALDVWPLTQLPDWLPHMLVVVQVGCDERLVPCNSTHIVQSTDPLWDCEIIVDIQPHDSLLQFVLLDVSSGVFEMVGSTRLSLMGCFDSVQLKTSQLFLQDEGGQIGNGSLHVLYVAAPSAEASAGPSQAMSQHTSPDEPILDEPLRAAPVKREIDSFTEANLMHRPLPQELPQHYGSVYQYDARLERHSWMTLPEQLGPNDVDRIRGLMVHPKPELAVSSDPQRVLESLYTHSQIRSGVLNEVEEFIADDNMDEGERQLLLRSLTQPQIVAPPMPPIRSIVHHAPASRPPSSAPIRQSQEYEQNLINADLTPEDVAHYWHTISDDRLVAEARERLMGMSLTAP